MSGTFPELADKQDHIIRVISEEEESFSKTLNKGLIKFKELADNTSGGVLSMEDAHFLYYAEAGGQISMITSSGAVISITNVQLYGSYWICGGG